MRFPLYKINQNKNPKSFYITRLVSIGVWGNESRVIIANDILTKRKAKSLLNRLNKHGLNHIKYFKF